MRIYSHNKYTLIAYAKSGTGSSVVDKGDEVYILMLSTFQQDKQKVKVNKQVTGKGRLDLGPWRT